MRQYMLVTDRMYLVLSHPKLAKKVADFNVRNKERLADTEPARPAMYYTVKGVKEYLKADYKDSMKGVEYRYYLTMKGEDEVIGTVCLSSISYGSVKSGTLSYKLDAGCWGKGLATEAVREVVNFAFNILRLHRIEAQVMPRNARSLRVMEKLGFEKEGLAHRCLEVNNKWEDHYTFALLNDKISRVQHYDF